MFARQVVFSLVCCSTNRKLGVGIGYRGFVTLRRRTAVVVTSSGTSRLWKSDYTKDLVRQ